MSESHSPFWHRCFVKSKISQNTSLNPSAPSIRRLFINCFIQCTYLHRILSTSSALLSILPVMPPSQVNLSTSFCACSMQFIFNRGFVKILISDFVQRQQRIFILICYSQLYIYTLGRYISKVTLLRVGKYISPFRGNW